jgi:hypothetical protein
VRLDQDQVGRDTLLALAALPDDERDRVLKGMFGPP